MGSFFHVDVCNVHFTCSIVAVKHYERIHTFIHEIGNGELIFYPRVINQGAFCASVECAYFIHTEVYTISTTLNPCLYDEIIVVGIRAHILRGSKEEAGTIVVVFCLQYARFAFVVFKPREVYLTISALRKLLKISFFIEVKHFVRINRFRREYVKFFRCGIRYLRAVRRRYFHTISTDTCRRKLAVCYAYFRFRFTFYVINLDFRCVSFGEDLCLIRRQGIFFAYFTISCVIDGNKRNLFRVNVSNVNRTFCHRFAVEHKEQVLAVFHKYGNGEFIFYPFIVFNLTFIFIITVFFIQAQMMKRSINIRFQYDIGIISVCVDVLRRNEMEVGTIVVICQLQYARFAFVAFKPREGNSTGQTILRNLFKVLFFIEVKDFTRINGFRNFFGQHLKIKRCAARILRTVGNSRLNAIGTCYCRSKFPVSNGNFRFRFAVHQIYFYDRRAVSIRVLTCDFR